MDVCVHCVSMSSYILKYNIKREISPRECTNIVWYHVDTCSDNFNILTLFHCHFTALPISFWWTVGVHSKKQLRIWIICFLEFCGVYFWYIDINVVSSSEVEEISNDKTKSTWAWIWLCQFLVEWPWVIYFFLGLVFIFEKCG